MLARSINNIEYISLKTFNFLELYSIGIIKVNDVSQIDIRSKLYLTIP